MYIATLTNLYRDIEVDLTADETRMQVISITGLSPAPAAVSTSVVTGLDGEIVNSARVQKRPIVITLQLNDAEEVRTELEELFYPTAEVRFKIKTDSRDVYIDGVVETFEADLFAESQRAQISILCPQPYFIGAEQVTNISAWTTVPGQIPNVSNIPMGIVITATDFPNGCTAFGVGNDQSNMLTVEYAFEANDILTIDTRVGSRKVTLTRSGVTTSIIGSITDSSRFFVLRASDNVFAVNADRLVYHLTGTGMGSRPRATVKAYYSRPHAGV